MSNTKHEQTEISNTDRINETLENTEGAIKNRQSRKTGNIGQTLSNTMVDARVLGTTCPSNHNTE